MSSDKIEIVLSAQDRASPKVKQVEDRLLGLSKSARLLHRETYGVSKFANAIDTVAGTRLGNLISDLTTVAEVAHPLKDLGSSIEANIAGAFSNLADRPAISAAITKAGALMSGKLGMVMKVASVVAVAAIADEVSPQINQAGHDLGRQLFGGVAAQMGSSEERGILYGTIFDSIGDATNRAAMDVIGPNSALNRFHIWDHAHGLFYMSPKEAEKIGEHVVKAVGDGITNASHSNMDGVWYKSSQAMTGDLSTALQGNLSIVQAEVQKAQLAAQHPNALAGQEAMIQRGIDKIDALENQAGTTAEQRTIYEQSKLALRNQFQNISGQRAPMPTYGPPTPQVYSPPTPEFGRTSQGSFVPPHSHPIYISGNKVMDALDPVMGKRMALASRTPYSR